MEEIGEAAADCTQAIQLKPDLASAFYYRAIGYLNEGRLRSRYQ